MGVRRQAGYHATAINNLVTAFPSEAAFGRHADSERGRRGGDESALEAGVGGGRYQSTEGTSGVVGNGNADVLGEGGDASGDSDALLGGVGEVAETFQQGFQDFLAALQERPLREHIGHTPVQVLAGGVLGVVVGTAYAVSLAAYERKA